jgi:hypothetical protein
MDLEGDERIVVCIGAQSSGKHWGSNFRQELPVETPGPLC